jgi:aminopeptidase YwaD
MMIPETALEDRIRAHLITLAGHIGPRPTGSQGNQRAGAYLREQFTALGWRVETPVFACKTWEAGAVSLTCDGQALDVQINPYSPPFSGQFPVVVCNSLDSLREQGSLTGRIVALTGELAQDQYMPRRFPFMRFDEQIQVLDALESAQPEAIIGVRAAPLFCDADFPIPSVTLAPADETRLLGCQGRVVGLSVQSVTIPSTGFNVIARRDGGARGKIVLCAHYDTWFDTPGALDNAAGVAALLALAEIIGSQPLSVELVAFNGEDHYAAPGQVDYLAGDVSGIGFVINVDGIGAISKQNSLAWFGEDQALRSTVASVKQDFPALVEVERWPQGDHMIFVLRGVPAIALSSADAFDLWWSVTHSPSDTVDQVSPAKIAEVVTFVARLLNSLSM